MAQSKTKKEKISLKSATGNTALKDTHEEIRICRNHLEKWEEEYLYCNIECSRLIGYNTMIKIGSGLLLLSIVIMFCIKHLKYHYLLDGSTTCSKTNPTVLVRHGRIMAVYILMPNPTDLWIHLPTVQYQTRRRAFNLFNRKFAV